LFRTPRAFHHNLDTLFHAFALGVGDGIQAFILSFFAGFAAFGRIVEFFIPEEGLFPYRPDKIFLTVDAIDGAVDKLICEDRDCCCLGFDSVGF